MTARHDLTVFAGLRGDTFLLRMAGGLTQDLELVDVRDLGRRSTAGGELSNYALTFRGAQAAPALPQATYRLEHARLGPIDVFLVPVARDRTAILYEAIFN